MKDFIKVLQQIGIDGHKELLKEFEEGAQNRFRNNDYRSFEEWVADKEDEQYNPPTKNKRSCLHGYDRILFREDRQATK